MATSGVVEARTLSVPDGIESSLAKLVYLYLDAAGAASIDDLQADLDLQRIELHPVLDRLADRGLVTAADGGYRID
jgi:predicted transcriptional regulator